MDRSSAVLQPFISKLRHGAQLDQADVAVLEGGRVRVEHVGADCDLAREGARPGEVRLVLEGLVCRYQTAANGRTQILAFLIPGDICDLHISILESMDHSIRTLTSCKIAHLPEATIDEWMSHRNVNRALWWDSLVHAAITRQWILNLGARRADEKIAHLFLELFYRFRAVGLASDKGYALPVTQEELGESLGMSGVHVNRVLTRLKERGLVTFQRHRVAFDDLEGLTALAGFQPGYLHLRRPAEGNP